MSRTVGMKIGIKKPKGVKMETDMINKNELRSYESIIQNLLALKEEAGEIKQEEASAIEAILANLSVLREQL